MKFLLTLTALSMVSATLAQPVNLIHSPEVHAYHGPPAPLAHDGRVVDTPEVAHAKAAHFHAYNEELSKTKGHLGGGDYVGQVGQVGQVGHHQAVIAPIHHGPVLNYADSHSYHGPPAPLAHDGRVIDTPEVTHAKANHFHAYAEELSKVSHHQPYHAAGPSYHYL